MLLAAVMCMQEVHVYCMCVRTSWVGIVHFDKKHYYYNNVVTYLWSSDY